MAGHFFKTGSNAARKSLLDSQFLFITALIFLIQNLAPGAAQSTVNFTCPAISTIYPCSCDSDDSINPALALMCTGPEITGEAITRLINETRRINNYPVQLKLYSLTISSTPLQELDLNVLVDMKIESSLNIQNNSRLSKFTHPAAPNIKFDVNILDISKNNLLTNVEIGVALRFANPVTSPRSLYIASRKFTNITGQLIIPGLSGFQQIQNLNFADSDIRAIDDKTFGNKTDRPFNFLSVRNSGLEFIGEDALTVNGKLMPEAYIDLTGNRLNDRNIHPKFIKAQWGDRRYVLDAKSNNFDHLSSALWERLLKPYGPVDQLSFSDNAFICDERMRWLQVRIDLIYSVWFVRCSNDPGKDVFTSDMVKLTTTVKPDSTTSSAPLHGVSGFIFMSLAVTLTLFVFEF